MEYNKMTLSQLESERKRINKEIEPLREAKRQVVHYKRKAVMVEKAKEASANMNPEQRAAVIDVYTKAQTLGPSGIKSAEKIGTPASK